MYSRHQKHPGIINWIKYNSVTIGGEEEKDIAAISKDFILVTLKLLKMSLKIK